jgi:hypothetical protein
MLWVFVIFNLGQWRISMAMALLILLLPVVVLQSAWLAIASQIRKSQAIFREFPSAAPFGRELCVAPLKWNVLLYINSQARATGFSVKVIPRRTQPLLCILPASSKLTKAAS